MTKMESNKEKVACWGPSLLFEITNQEQNSEHDNKASMAWQRLPNLVIFVVEIKLRRM